MPKKPPADDSVGIAEAREIRDHFKKENGGELIAAAMDAGNTNNRQISAALLTSPVPLRGMTDQVRNRLLEIYFGEAAVEGLAAEQEAIDMLQAALDRAEALAES